MSKAETEVGFLTLEVVPDSDAAVAEDLESIRPVRSMQLAS